MQRYVDFCATYYTISKAGINWEGERNCFDFHFIAKILLANPKLLQQGVGFVKSETEVQPTKTHIKN